MKTNSDMTLYKKSVVAGDESWTREVVRNVHWETVDGMLTRRDASIADNKVTVFIPFSRGSVVINDGDVIVKGHVSDVISTNFTMTDLKKKYGSSAVFTVKNVAIRDFGEAHMQHWQVGAS